MRRERYENMLSPAYSGKDVSARLLRVFRRTRGGIGRKGLKLPRRVLFQAVGKYCEVGVSF